MHHLKLNSLEAVKLVQTEFKAVLPLLISDICSETRFKDIQSSLDWLEVLLSQNVPYGKQARALLHIRMYQHLNPNRTKEDDFLSYVFGWIIEILQTSALIADDIIDGSETRRGRPCWYKNHSVGMSAINDVLLLENIAYFITIKYFQTQDYFLNMLLAIHDCSLKTILGECLDTRLGLDKYESITTTDNNTKTKVFNFDKYNEATYKALVKYKTGYYTFYTPVLAAVIMSGINDESIQHVLEDITLKIGELYQIQDDFLDVYGDPTITGKIGTDIKDGKLNWCIVKALGLASPQQKQILENNYGQGNIPNAESQIKTIFKDLKIQECFYIYEKQTRFELIKDIQNLPSLVPKEPFLYIIDLIYRREK